jgi:MoxR-like ATPase
MKLNTVISRMAGWYKTSVYLKSQPGRGKTETLVAGSEIIGKQIGKNLGHVVINGPLLTPADAVGYLIPKHNEDGTATSLYTDPFWFKTKDGKNLGEFDGGIVIVDEADKMDADTKKVIGEAALSGRLGPHKLSDGWVVWMAGNRSEDRSGSTKELDHLINRRMEIDITDDIESWNDWAVTRGVMPITVAFANQHPQIVFSEKVAPGVRPGRSSAWTPTSKCCRGATPTFRTIRPRWRRSPA